MKHILRHTGLCLLACSLLSLTACSDEVQSQQSSGGTLGEITLDRTRIGAYQPFNAQCKVTSGNHLLKEDVFWEGGNINVFNPSASDQYKTQDGTSTYYLHGFTPGTHTLTCEMTSIGEDGQQHSSTRNINVQVVATDIRNNFWGESKDETRRNLTYYNSFQEQDEVFYIVETDKYDSHADYSSEIKNGIETDAPRIVSYHFDANGCLSSILYTCQPGEYESDLVKALTNRKRYLERMNGFGNSEFDYEILSDASLSPEEQALAEQFKAGTLEKEESGTLAGAVAEKRLRLLISMTGETSVAKMSLELSKGNDMYIYQDYQAKPSAR